MKVLWTLSALVSLASAAGKRNRNNDDKHLFNTGRDWVTLDNGVQFQPGQEMDPRIEHVRKLWSGNQDNFDPYHEAVIDGGETVYDEYSQAWRALGFYIDCDANEADYYEEGGDRRRSLKEEDQQQGACLRYMLWAAYIDLDYEGGGVGEYMYYDRKTKSWDDYACKWNDGTRCVKMDCHEPNSNFKLLGYFKEPSYTEWFEQLFKHAGDCVWGDNEYEFMQRYRRSWPQLCTKSTTTYDESGNYLYYDTKPSAYGTMDIGLYTDSRCALDYAGSISVETVLYKDLNGQVDDDDYDYGDDSTEGSLYGLEEELKAWNEAFGVFKICLPCKAFDMNSLSIGYQDQVSGNNTLRYGFWETDDGDNDDGDKEYHNDEGFRCRDDAGYQDVNQCMKFATHTIMQPALLNDVILAENQGTVTGAQVGQKQYGLSESQVKRQGLLRLINYIFLIGSAVLFLWSMVEYVKASRNLRQSSLNLREPLVMASQGVVA